MFKPFVLFPKVQHYFPLWGSFIHVYFKNHQSINQSYFTILIKSTFQNTKYSQKRVGSLFCCFFLPRQYYTKYSVIMYIDIKTDSLLIESSPGRFGGDLIGGRRFLRLAVGSGGEKTRHYRRLLTLR